MLPRAPLASVQEVYRDAHVLVLVKPPGLPTTSPDGGDCLVQRAQALDPEAPALHALSRLDAMVSGLVAFARTRDFNHLALEARRAGTFGRCYVAVTAHAPAPAHGHWSWPIALHQRDPRLRRALAEGETGDAQREARTHYAVQGEASGLWALRLWPQTGRTHQLRVHAAQAGCALLGDTSYGAAKRITLADGNVLSSRRVQLHCGWLRLPHPEAAVQRLEISAPALPDMLTLWQAAGGSPDALVAGRE